MQFYPFIRKKTTNPSKTHQPLTIAHTSSGTEVFLGLFWNCGPSSSPEEERPSSTAPSTSNVPTSASGSGHLPPAEIPSLGGDPGLPQRRTPPGAHYFVQDTWKLTTFCGKGLKLKHLPQLLRYCKQTTWILSCTLL